MLKIGYQLKQVRERLAKGLVDKGVLRTEKRNFLLFDMATHPVADLRVKDAVVSRVVALLTAGTSAVPPAALPPPGTQMRALRTVCLACSAYAASVLDNAFSKLGYEERETAFARCDDVLAEFAVWPFGATGSSGSTGSKKREGPRIAMGSSGSNGREAVLGLLMEVRKELVGGDEDTGCELIAGVLETAPPARLCLRVYIPIPEVVATHRLNRVAELGIRLLCLEDIHPNTSHRNL